MSVSVSVLKYRAARAARWANHLESTIRREMGNNDSSCVEGLRAFDESEIVAEVETRLAAVDAEAERLRVERRDESRAYAAMNRSTPRDRKADAVSVGLARLGR